MKQNQIEYIKIIYRLCLKKNLDINTILNHWYDYKKISVSFYNAKEPRFIKILNKYRNI